MSQTKYVTLFETVNKEVVGFILDLSNHICVWYNISVYYRQIEESVMTFDNTNIGRLIANLREEQGYTQLQLCHGICAVSTLAKIESGVVNPDHFMIDWLIERLGRSAGKLEYVLSKGEYRLYELQYKIQDEICRYQGSMKVCRQMLSEYREAAPDSSIHLQYVEQMEAQLLWLERAPAIAILEKLETAIHRTMNNCEEFGYALNAVEIRLLLFRYEIMEDLGVNKDHGKRQLFKIIDYIEGHIKDREEAVKVYPYATILLSKNWINQEMYGILEPCISKAFHMLTCEGRIIFLQEIIEIYIVLQKYVEKESEKAKELQAQHDALVEVCRMYNYYIYKIRMLSVIDREFTLDYELIRKNRMAKRITQEELSDGICSPESLSRIEKGKQVPSVKKFQGLAGKLDLRNKKINTVINAVNFELIMIRRQIEHSIYRMDWESAQIETQKLKCLLDMNDVENQQYIENVEHMLKRSKGEMSYKDAMEECRRLIAYTIREWESIDLKGYLLSRIESNIFNQMAIAYAGNEEKEKSIKIYRTVLECYQNSGVDMIFHVREISTIFGNLASVLEETDQLSEARNIADRKMHLSIKASKGNDFGRTLCTIALTYKKQNDDKCWKYYWLGLNLLKLMKNDVRYKLVYDHILQINPALLQNYSIPPIGP